MNGCIPSFIKIEFQWWITTDDIEVGDDDEYNDDYIIYIGSIDDIISILKVSTVASNVNPVLWRWNDEMLQYMMNLMNDDNRVLNSSWVTVYLLWFMMPSICVCYNLISIRVIQTKIHHYCWLVFRHHYFTSNPADFIVCVGGGLPK